MTDKNNLIVYCEFDEGKVADVSLELLTKGRELAKKLGVKLEALVIGDKLDGVENQIFPYGVMWCIRWKTSVFSPMQAIHTQPFLSSSLRR